MPDYPIVSGKETIKALEKGGFARVSQRGSHVKMRKTESHGAHTVIVPLRKVIRIGTLKSILRQAHLTPEEFGKLLK